MAMKNIFDAVFSGSFAARPPKSRALRSMFPVSSFPESQRAPLVLQRLRNRSASGVEVGESRFARMLPVGVGETTRHGLFENVEREDAYDEEARTLRQYP